MQSPLCPNIPGLRMTFWKAEWNETVPSCLPGTGREYFLNTSSPATRDFLKASKICFMHFVDCTTCILPGHFLEIQDTMYQVKTTKIITKAGQMRNWVSVEIITNYSTYSHCIFRFILNLLKIPLSVGIYSLLSNDTQIPSNLSMKTDSSRDSVLAESFQ